MTLWRVEEYDRHLYRHPTLSAGSLLGVYSCRQARIGLVLIVSIRRLPKRWIKKISSRPNWDTVSTSNPLQLLPAWGERGNPPIVGSNNGWFL